MFVPTNGMDRGLKRVLARARPSRPTIAIESGAFENPSPAVDSGAAKSCSAGPGEAALCCGALADDVGAVADGGADVPPAAACDGFRLGPAHAAVVSTTSETETAIFMFDLTPFRPRGRSGWSASNQWRSRSRSQAPTARQPS